MKKLLWVIAASIAVGALAKPAQAEVGQNYVGPSVIFGNRGGSAFGIDSKFGIGDTFSLRPNIYFQNGGTTVGAAATYDFNSVDYDRKLTPFVGAGVSFGVGNNNGVNNNATGYATAGADYNLNESIALKGAVSVPFDSTNYSTTFGVSAGLRF